MSLKKKEHTIPLVQIPAHQKDVTKRWKEVKATVSGDHEIPDRVAKRVQIRVPNAPVGSIRTEIAMSNVRQLNLLFPLFGRDMSPTP